MPNPDIIHLIASTGGAFGTACYAGHFRHRIREKYGIQGNLRGDICTHLWCSPFALCQETEELYHQNKIMNGTIDFTKAPYIQVMTDIPE